MFLHLCVILFLGGGLASHMTRGDLHAGGICIWGVCMQGGVGKTPPILQDMVNKWKIRILLECILVVCNFKINPAYFSKENLNFSGQ